MILIGQYDSPYTRRVAVSLGILGLEFEHDARSVFGDFDSMRTVNPLGRVPSLVMEDGTVLIDSAAILDWLDRTVGPERALLPPDGLPRQQALQRIALATGTIDKVMASAYERWFVRRPIAGPNGSGAAEPRQPAGLPRWRRIPGRRTHPSIRRASPLPA